MNCRNDWHQTPDRVTIAIYCKKYDPDVSYVETGPVRLKTHVSFPEEAGVFDWDIELTGVRQLRKCDLPKSNLSFFLLYR